MRRRAYGGPGVNHVPVSRLAQQRPGQPVVLGADIGKFEVRVLCRWASGEWERPWRVRNPSQLGELLGVVQELRQGRKLVVAMEPSGTYGDALRQALHDAQIEVWRVSPKAAHDYAEVFDGVPSQHDGKDAAVVAELAAYGKGSVWPVRARLGLGTGAALLGGLDGRTAADPAAVAGPARRVALRGTGRRRRGC